MQPPPGGPQPPAPSPAPRTPGTVTAVRVLLIVGGAIGVLLGLLSLAGLAALPALEDMPEARETFARQDIPMDEITGQLALGAAEGLVYGVIALVLAFLIGRRSPVVLWAAAVFFGLAGLYSLGSMLLTGGVVVNALSLLFNVAALVLLFVPDSRAHYGRTT